MSRDRDKSIASAIEFFFESSSNAWGIGGGAKRKSTMPDPQNEASAVTYIKDVMRSRTPAYIADGSVGTPPPSQRPARASSLRQALELRTDSVLSQAIPANSPYNKQRLYAMRAILDGKLHGLNPEVGADVDKISKVINGIHARKPEFPATISPGVVADLYDKLEKYAGVSDNANPYEFPPMEVLGLRSDEPVLDARGATASTRRIKDWEMHRASLRDINRLLDQIVPDGAHYNGVRQGVIDEVQANGKSVRSWFERQHEIDGERKKSGVDFIPNSYHQRKKGVMDALEHKVRPAREELQRSQREKTPRKLTLNEAVDIATFMERHHAETEKAHADTADEHTTKRQRLDNGAVSVRPLSQVPQDIKVAVRREIPYRTPDNSTAKDLANRVADSMEAVIAPDRDNFYRRTRFLQNVSDNRDYWLEPGTVNTEKRPKLFDLINSGYYHTLKKKEVEIQVLVKDLEYYHQACQGRLREMPARPSTVPQPRAAQQPKTSAGPAAKNGGKPKITANQKRLQEAGRASGQTKLNFTSVKTTRRATGEQGIEPSSSRRTNTGGPSIRPAHNVSIMEVDANPCSSATEATGSTPPNRKRPREELDERRRENSRSS